MTTSDYTKLYSWLYEILLYILYVYGDKTDNPKHKCFRQQKCQHKIKQQIKTNNTFLRVLTTDKYGGTPFQFVEADMQIVLSCNNYW